MLIQKEQFWTKKDTRRQRFFFSVAFFFLFWLILEPNTICLANQFPPEIQFTIQCSENRFYACVLNQKGIDFEISLLNEQKELMCQYDSPNGAFGQETIQWLATSSGNWTLKLTPVGKSAPNNPDIFNWLSKITETQDPTFQQNEWWAAQKNYNSALQLQKKNPALALEPFRLALEGFQKAEDTCRQGFVLSDLGQTYLKLNRLTEAEQSLTQSAELLEKGNILDGLAVAYKRQGRLFELSWKLREAATSFDRAALLYAQLNNLIQQGYALANAARLFDLAGNKDQAAQKYAQAITCFPNTEPSVASIIALKCSLGKVKMDQGIFDEAYQLLFDAYNQAQFVQNKTLEASIAQCLATVYAHTGNYDTAEWWLRQKGIEALPVGSFDQGVAWLNLAAILSLKNNIVEAIQSVETARKIFNQIRIQELEKTKDLEYWLAVGDYQFAKLQLKINQPDAAKNSLNAALKKFETMNLVNLQGWCWLEKARVSNLETDADTARQLFFKTGDHLGMIDSLILLAKIYTHNKKNSQAILLLNEAIKKIEHTRIDLFEMDARIVYLETVHDAFTLRATLDPDPMQSYFWWEKGKTILQSESGAAFSDKTLTANNEIQKLKLELRGRLAAQSVLHKTNLTSQGAFFLTTLNHEINDLEATLAKLELEKKLKNPHPNSLAAPFEVTQFQKNLTSGTVALNYLISENGSFLYVITNESINRIELAANGEIDQQALEVYEHLATTSSKINPKSLLKQTLRLQKLILPDNLHPLISQAKTLIVLQSGKLELIPFSVLPVIQKQSPLLISISSVRLYTKLTNHMNDVASSKKESLNSGKIAYFGNPISKNYPSLPYSEKFILNLQRTFPPSQLDTFTQSQVTVRSATKALQTAYKLVHFATHGLPDPEQPVKSSLLMSAFDDQSTLNPTLNPSQLKLETEDFLTGKDIQEMTPQATGVILDACAMKTGLQTTAQGTLSFGQLLLLKGVPGVIAPLWAIDDQLATEFMQILYQYIQKGHSLPRAFHLAQQSAQKKLPVRIWAAYTYSGILY